MKLGLMTIKNLFSHKNSEIDFSLLKLALFKGENGTGKSSIFDILCWTFYGQTARKKYKKILRDVPDKPKSGSAIINFTTDGIAYKIERTIGTGKSLKLYEGGKLSKLRTQTLVQERIDAIIGVDFKTFLNIAYFSQGDIGKFLTNESSDRIKVVTDMINELSEIDTLRTLIEKDSKKNSYETENLKGQLLAHKEIKSSIDIGIIRDKSKSSKRELKETLSTMAIVGAKLAAIKNKKQLELDYVDKKGHYNNLLKNSQDTLRELKQKAEQLESDASKYDKKVAEYDKLVHSLKGYDDVKLELQQLQKDINVVENGITGLKTKIKMIQTEIQSLQKVADMKNSTCPTCRSVIDDESVKHLESLIKEKQELIEKYIGEVEDKNKQLKQHLEVRTETENKISKLNELVVKRNELKHVLKRISEYKDEAEIVRKKHTESTLKLTEQLKSYKDKALVVKTALNKLAKYNVNELNETEKAYNELDSQVDILESEINKLKIDNDRYYVSVKKITAIEKELLIFSEQDKITDFWKQALPRIKVDMIGGIIPFIESETNKYLSQILPGKMVKFLADPDKANNKLDVMICDYEHGVERIYEGWSGGEKSKMSISVYLALNKLASVRSGKAINFIILDEKFSAIDSKSRLVLLEMLKSEYKDRNTFAISHVENLDNEFSKVVNVKLENSVSKIIVTGT